MFARGSKCACARQQTHSHEGADKFAQGNKCMYITRDLVHVASKWLAVFHPEVLQEGAQQSVQIFRGGPCSVGV